MLLIIRMFMLTCLSSSALLSLPGVHSFMSIRPMTIPTPIPIPIPKNVHQNHVESYQKYLYRESPMPTSTTQSTSMSMSLSGSESDGQGQTYSYPKVIIFDLDGCLWTPEMYEINYFMGARGSPFTIDPDEPLNLLTEGGEPVKLLGDVRSVMRELYLNLNSSTRTCSNHNVKVGISSRTDEPEWARELLEKFPIPLGRAIGENEDNDNDDEVIALEKVFNGPIEIAKDSKVDHFWRIAKECNVEMEEVLFFDNEYGNCKSVANLGVSVVYCPDGITKEIWDLGFAPDGGFPRTDGSVIGADSYY